MAKLFKLFVFQPGHDPVQGVDLLPLPRRHQPGVLSPDVEGEDCVADLEAGEADGESAGVARRRLSRHAAAALRTFPRAGDDVVKLFFVDYKESPNKLERKFASLG